MNSSWTNRGWSQPHPHHERVWLSTKDYCDPSETQHPNASLFAGPRAIGTCNKEPHTTTTWTYRATINPTRSPTWATICPWTYPHHNHMTSYGMGTSCLPLPNHGSCNFDDKNTRHKCTGSAGFPSNTMATPHGSMPLGTSTVVGPRCSPGAPHNTLWVLWSAARGLSADALSFMPDMVGLLD